MEQPFGNNNTTAGTVGGILVVLLFKIGIDDLLVSAVLAAVGAAVSFGVSVMLKCIIKKFTRK